MALNSEVSINRVKHPRYNWRATFYGEGKDGKETILQRYFKNRAQADEFKGERERESQAHGKNDLTKDERSAVIKFRADLQRVGIDVHDALKIAIEFKERAERSAPIATLVKELIEAKAKEGKSARYLEDLRLRLGRFAKDFGNELAASITAESISDWLTNLNLAPLTVKNYRRLLVVLFNEGKRRRYCQGNPAKDSHKPTIPETEIGIVTPAEANMILEGASDAILPVIAIGFFAGVRTEELMRMDWSEVDLAGGHIKIKGATAKKARRRLIKIQGNLTAWLQPHAKLSGKIWPANGREHIDQARSHAGFGKGKIWPANGMRHSFASYHLAKFQNAAELALEMGHTDTRIIFQHYREVVHPTQAESYWSLAPSKVSNIVPMAANG